MNSKAAGRSAGHRASADNSILSAHSNASITTSTTSRDSEAGNHMRPTEIVEQLEDDEIEMLYESTLDHLLTPEAVKAKLIETESIEKKRTMVKMHKDVLDNVKFWDQKEEDLLESIRKANTPDIAQLTQLKVMLSSANRQVMNSFLRANGVQTLLKALDHMSSRFPLTEFDTSIIFETLQCCKAVMNNGTGMDGFVAIEGSIDIIAKCLNFENKNVALLVVEILSVCCYCNESYALMVIEGMRNLARIRKEAPFAIVAAALTEQDVEVKANVMQFLNTMVTSVVESDFHIMLRNDLNNLDIGKRYVQALRHVNRDVQVLESLENASTSKGSNNVKSNKKSSDDAEDEYGDTDILHKKMMMVTLYGPRAIFNDRRRQGSYKPLDMEAKSQSMKISRVNPNEGTMAGILTVVKEGRSSAPSAFHLMLTSSTKKRWYELDQDNLKWCSSVHKEGEFKGFIPVSEMKDIRQIPDAEKGHKTSGFGFAIETNARIHEMYCDTGATRDNWILALLTCRDNYVLRMGVVKSKVKELSFLDVKSFADKFRRQGTVYLKLSQEDHEQSVKSCGLDVSDLHSVWSFLRMETLVLGLHPKLLKILHELILIPPSALGIWDSTAEGIRILRNTVETDSSHNDAMNAFQSESVMDLFHSKTMDSGGQYANLSKLALEALSKDDEIARLQERIAELEHQISEMHEGGATYQQKSNEDNDLTTDYESLLKDVDKMSAQEAIEMSGDSKMIQRESFHQSVYFKMHPSNDSTDADAQRLRTTSSTADINSQSMLVIPGQAKGSAMKDLRLSLDKAALYNKMQADGFSHEAIRQLLDGVEFNEPSTADGLATFKKYEDLVVNKKYTKEKVIKRMLDDGLSLNESEFENFYNLVKNPPVKRLSRRMSASEIKSMGSRSQDEAENVGKGVGSGERGSLGTGKGSQETETNERNKLRQYQSMRTILHDRTIALQMTLDGYTDHEIHEFLNSGTIQSVMNGTRLPISNLEPLAKVVEERYAKYDKMKKMLPEGAVRQKMQVEGFTEAEIEGFFNGTVGYSNGAVESAGPTGGPPVVDERYTKYEKMKKMLPEGAVRQKMQVEGFTEAEIDGFFNGTVGYSNGAVGSRGPPVVEERYAKYDKMKKMLPEGAVRQKMQVEGFTEAEIEGFFNGTVGYSNGAVESAGPTGGPPVVDERYTKYEKMKKMLPEGAVRQKMQVEGFTEAEIDGFFNGTLGTGGPGGDASLAVVDERFAKFDKMRKMLPEGAVRQKMQVDGFTEAEIDNFFSSNIHIAKPMVVVPNAEDKFAKYDKMRKMLPEAAVRQRMAQDNIPEKDIEKYFGTNVAAVAAKPGAKKEDVVDPPPEGMAFKPLIKPSVKLKALFWTKLKNNEIPGTVWHKLNEFNLQKSDIEQIEEQFATKVVAKPSTTATATVTANVSAVTPSQPKLISILDGKRSQNVSIVLGKLRMEPDDILKMIIELDPSVLNVDLTNTLINILPTPEELIAAKEHANSPDKLDKASRLMLNFSRVPRLNQRLKCHEISFSWVNSANASASQVSIVISACDELNKCQNMMEKILAMILTIGNYVNGDTKFGQAYGVKLDVFNKLCNLKAASNQDSLMNFLCYEVEKYYPELMKLSDSWVAIWAAESIALKNLQGDIAQLEAQINLVNMDLNIIKTNREKASNANVNSAVEKAREQIAEPLFKRLDAFINLATPRLAQIKANYQQAEKSVELIMKRYGEDFRAITEEDASKLFFSQIAFFARAYRAGIDANILKRTTAEKNQRLAAENQTRRQSIMDQKTTHKKTGKKKTKTQKDIFSKYHEAQNATADQVLHDFQTRRMNSLRQGSGNEKFNLS